MYKIAFEEEAQKEFLKLDKNSQKLVANKILDLQNGNFSNDKSLKGKHKGKFRKRAGNYRIIYLKENDLLVITIIRVAHRKEVYF
jgi:mRNA interferase RelE/StbE